MNSVHKASLNLIQLAALVVLLSGCGGTGIQTASVTGTITINGQPTQGIELKFVSKEKMRPSVALTDAQGRYKAEFVSNQSGVVLGPCVVQFSVFRGGNYMTNYLPAKFNQNAENTPEFNLDIPAKGIVFNYDIKHDGKIPPYTPEG